MFCSHISHATYFLEAFRHFPSRATMINFAVALKCLWAFVALGLYGRVASQTPPGSVVMKIINNCGLPIDLYWVNSFEKSRPLVRQTTTSIRNNTDTIVSSEKFFYHLLTYATNLISCTAWYLRSLIELFGHLQLPHCTISFSLTFAPLFKRNIHTS